VVAVGVEIRRGPPPPAHCRFRPPATGTLLIWEILEYCNLLCTHCCTDSGPTLPRTSKVSTEDAFAVLDALPGLGVASVVFSGGEPFFRHDFVELLEHADSTRLNMFVNTNGFKVDPTVARRVASAGVRRLTVSIDGHNADLHNAVRGHPASFARACRAARSCVEEGVDVRVSGVITPDLVPHLEEYVAMVHDLGVREAVVSTAFPAGRAARHPEIHVPAGDELEATLDDLARRYRERGFTLDFNLTADAGDESLAPTSCEAGRRILHMTADGDVSGCSWLYKLDPARFRLGNVTEQPLERILTRVSAVIDPLLALTEGCPLPHVPAVAP
jgi:MoaA/NifB/PqqE/SkfB family radical SAM enzyme